MVMSFELGRPFIAAGECFGSFPGDEEGRCK